MPTVFIVIKQFPLDTTPGALSTDELVLNQPVILNNNNDTGVITWLWQFIDKPENSSATLSTPTQAISGFTPDVAGTYLIRLTVNGTQFAQVGAAVKTANLKYRIPAAREEQEFDYPNVNPDTQKGWGPAIKHTLQIIDDGYGNLLDISNNNIIAGPGLIGGGSLVNGDVTISMPVIAAPGTYFTATNDSFVLDAYGRITSILPVTRNLIAGIGLDGGGDLSVDRTFDLSAFGTPGIYTTATGDQFIFDAYGRESSVTTVTRNINTSIRLTGGGSVINDLFIDLAISGIIDDTYQGITFDAYGRATSASLISIDTEVGHLTGGGDLNNSRILGLAPTGTAGSYSYITFDAYGRETGGVLNSILTDATLVGGGDLSATRTLGLALTGTAGVYTTATGDSFTFDAYGRETSVSTVVRNINTEARLTGGGDLSADRNLDLAAFGPGAGSYAWATGDSVDIDAYGRIANITNVTRLINTSLRLTGGANLSSDLFIDLAASGIISGTYQGIDFDAYGRAVNASLISINTEARLTGGGDLNVSRTLDLATSGVIPGNYSYVSADAYGRITNGSLININTVAGQLTGGGSLNSDLTLNLDVAGTIGSIIIGDGYIEFDAYGRETSWAQPTDLVLLSPSLQQNGSINIDGYIALDGYKLQPSNSTEDDALVYDGTAYVPQAISIRKNNAIDILLTDTNPHNIVAYVPNTANNYVVYFYYRVITATTNITVVISWTDGTGAQSATVLNASPQAVGSYGAMPTYINAAPGSPITVTATAGTANQIYISSSIVQL